MNIWYRSFLTFRCFFSWWCTISSQACIDQYSTEYSKGTLWRYLEFCLCASLSSVVLCPANSSHPCSPKLPALSPQLGKTTRIWLNVLSLHHSLVTFSSWGNLRAYYICFLSGLAILFQQNVFLGACTSHCVFIKIKSQNVWTCFVNHKGLCNHYIILLLYKNQLKLNSWML